MLTYLWLYIKNWLIWIDEGVNTLRGGDPGESLSVAAAVAEGEKRLWGCILCRMLGWIEKDHCAKALAEERKHSLWGD